MRHKIYRPLCIILALLLSVPFLALSVLGDTETAADTASEPQETSEDLLTEPGDEFDEDAVENSETFPDVSGAPYIYLYNFENDTVLYRKGEGNTAIYPASTVKILAGITAIEALGEEGLEKSVTITSQMLEQSAGNRIGFTEGEEVTAYEMINCMLVNSANDAAIILAYIVSGSVEDFVRLMNDKAFDIGARSSYFTNPTGLDDDAQKTTLNDTVRIAKYAYSNSLFMEIVGTPKYVMDATNKTDYRNIYNRNCLISKYYRADYYFETAIGMNAGSTVGAGYNIVAAARNEDASLTFLCVIMGADTKEAQGEEDSVLYNYTIARDLFTWAFDAYEYYHVITANTVVCEVAVGLSSTADHVTLEPTDTVTVYLPVEVDYDKEVKTVISTYEGVTAPVKKGDVLGQVRILYKDEEIGRADLIASNDVARSEILYAMDRIKKFTSGSFFITVVIAAVVLTVIYILIKARVRQKRYKSNNRGFR